MMGISLSHAHVRYFDMLWALANDPKDCQKTYHMKSRAGRPSPVVSSLINPRPLVSLSVEPSPEQYKERLQTFFARAQDKAEVKHIARIASLNQHITVIRSMLDTIGKACGLCFAKEGLILEHDPRSCDSGGETYRLAYESFTTSINTIHRQDWPRNAACFRCGVASIGGSNTMHPAYGQGPCKNPWLVLSIAFYVAKALRNDVNADMGAEVVGNAEDIDALTMSLLAKDTKFKMVLFKVVCWWWWTKFEQNQWVDFP